MDKTIKDRWVKALRSGEYEQALGALCREENGARSYCCLGVLTDLAIQDGVKGVRYASADSPNVSRVEVEYPFSGDWGASSGTLPYQVQEWAGLGSANPIVTFTNYNDHDDRASLADLNDNYGFTFDQIADVIEREDV